MSDRDIAIPVELQDVDTHPLLTGAKILVVDDTPANLIAAEAALAPLNRQIVLAASGQDALGHMLEQDFALVILDVNMPEMDGYETARWIRSRERTQHVPIIFMTAHDHDDAAVLRAYKLGAVDFLFKPVVADVLLAKASVFVALHERTEQLALERIERDFENRRRDYETTALRRERDRELAANKELARLNEALAEYDRRKDGFMAILAHELRNPLAPLQTAIDLIRETPTAPPSPRVIDVAERQTRVLVRLVDDLLDLSRIKADKIELRPEAAELRDIVEAAVITSRSHLEERNHTLTVVAPDRVIVVADANRVTQVVCNIINNAARYTAPGGRIDVNAGICDDDLAFVRVKDNGIGIPRELQHTIFKMFVQERVRSDGSGGLGLGLALSRTLIEMHHGEIACLSEGRDQGSTFEIRIPRLGSLLALPIRKPWTRDMQPLRSESPAPQHVRTVVIDDNDDAREMLCDLLRGKGYDVLAASDGPTGVGLIRQHQPHVALVDIGLPVLDGFGVVEVLRRECPELRTRLIALTGYGQSADHDRTKRAGFHAHLVKPASAASIVATVARLIDEARRGTTDPGSQRPMQLA